MRTKRLCAGIRVLRAAPAPLIGVGAGGTAGCWGQRGQATAAASSTRVSPRLSQPRSEVKAGGRSGRARASQLPKSPRRGETTQSCPPNPPLVPAVPLPRKGPPTSMALQRGRGFGCHRGAGGSQGVRGEQGPLCPPPQTMGAFECSECGPTARPHHEAPLSAA